VHYGIEMIGLTALDTFREDCSIEHEMFGQTPHLDEPIDGVTLSRNREATLGVNRQWDHAEIDIRGKSAIEAHFLAAIFLAGFYASEVEERVVNRFLKLVHAIAGHEDPRHVRLFDYNGLRAMSIGLA
jgi:hypothetical protein